MKKATINDLNFVKDKFNSFEELFLEAVKWEAVELSDKNSNKIIDSYDYVEHEIRFTEFLRENKGLPELELNEQGQPTASETTHKKYLKLLTRQNFKGYLEYTAKQNEIIKEKVNEAYEAWQPKKPQTSTPQQSKSYSLKQVAIAYAVLGITITEDKAQTILDKHTTLKSKAKLIQKRVNRVSDLSKPSGNKTTDTKHLKDLQQAKRLINGTKNTKAKTDIDSIITAFQTNCNN